MFNIFVLILIFSPVCGHFNWCFKFSPREFWNVQYENNDTTAWLTHLQLPKNIVFLHFLCYVYFHCLSDYSSLFFFFPTCINIFMAAKTRLLFLMKKWLKKKRPCSSKTQYEISCFGSWIQNWTWRDNWQVKRQNKVSGCTHPSEEINPKLLTTSKPFKYTQQGWNRYKSTQWSK